MKPEFPRANYAINSLLSFYEIYYIESYLDYWSGHTLLRDYKPNWADFTLSTIERMDDEICQTIHTTNHNTQVDMFEWLRAWMNDYRIAEVAVDEIVSQLKAENEKRLKIYEKEVDKKADEYFQQEDRKRAHLERYTVKFPSRRYFGGSMWLLNEGATSEERTNYNFYCIEQKPDLISDEHLPRYFDMIANLIDKFKDTIQPYLERYDSGKVIGSSQVSIATLQVLQKALPSASDETIPMKLKTKIKWNGSAQEFAEHFAPLINEHRLYIKNRNRNETDPIVERLYDCFEVMKENESAEIKVSTLKTNFKNFNAGARDRNTKNK